MNCNGIAWHGTATAGRGVDERSKGGAQQSTWTAGTAAMTYECVVTGFVALVTLLYGLA